MERLSPAAGHDPVAPAYERHRPEKTILYGVVQSELGSFLARVRDRPLPRFVEREFRGFLERGILAHGFLHVHCDACGRDRIVAFYCKGRGFRPSCLGRRMADTAAHLVDRVLPEAPVRQWVLTFPFAPRYRLAYDAALTSLVLREFVRGVFASYRRRARQHRPIRRPRGGAVTYIQRFGDALNLNVHFHTLMLDGVHERYGEPGMRFRGLPPPEDDDVRRVVERVAGRVARLLERRGLAIVGATARPRSCSSRSRSSAAWSPSSRPPAPTRSAITACSLPAPAGAIAWSPLDRNRARSRGPRAAGTLRTRRLAQLARARKGETAPVPRTAERRSNQRPSGAAAHCAAMPGRIGCAVCSRSRSWSVQIAAGGCGS